VAVNIAIGTGRRKTSVARVFIREGRGAITVNGKQLDDYFTPPGQSASIKEPLVVTNTEGIYDILMSVYGGGTSAQAGACKHGLSRALSSIDDANHSVLRKNGFLRRDSRMVERKKYGQSGARKKFQFSKR